MNIVLNILDEGFEIIDCPITLNKLTDLYSIGGRLMKGDAIEFDKLDNVMIDECWVSWVSYTSKNDSLIIKIYLVSLINDFKNK